MYTHVVRILRAFGTGFGVSLLAASTSFADVQLTMADGRVTLIATDATVPQILAEWARVGGATIVNAEKILGGPVTLELRDVPEQLALDVVLRSVSGYVAARRATFASNLSRFDRIVVMATSVAPRAAVTAPPTAPVAPQPALPQLSAPQAGDQDQSSPFDPFRQPQVAAPQAFPAASPGVFLPAGAGAQPATRVPTVPQGTTAPGMIPPPPPPPPFVSPSEKMLLSTGQQSPQPGE